MKFMFLNVIPCGSNSVSIDFQSPIRSGKNYDDWEYIFSLGFPKNEAFEISGKYEIFDDSGKTMLTRKFDKSTVSRSSWLQHETLDGWLVGGFIELKEGLNYKIKITLEKMADRDLSLYLHYNTHL